MTKNIFNFLFALPLGLISGAIACTLFDVFFVVMTQRNWEITGLDWLDVQFDQNLTKTIWSGVLWMVLANLPMGFVIGKRLHWMKPAAYLFALIGSLGITALVAYLRQDWMAEDLMLLLGSLGVVGLGASMAGVGFGVHQVPEMLGDNQNGYKF